MLSPARWGATVLQEQWVGPSLEGGGQGASLKGVLVLLSPLIPLSRVADLSCSQDPVSVGIGEAQHRIATMG